MSKKLIAGLLKDLISVGAVYQFINYGETVRFITTDQSVAMYIKIEALKANVGFVYREIDREHLIDIDIGK